MAKIQSVKFNFVMNSILTVSAMIFPVITYPYVTSILGPQGIGTVSFANSVVTYFSMFAQLGHVCPVGHPHLRHPGLRQGAG